MGKRERFRFSEERGEGRRGRLRGERIGEVVVNIIDEMVGRHGRLGWWFRT